MKYVTIEKFMKSENVTNIQLNNYSDNCSIIFTSHTHYVQAHTPCVCNLFTSASWEAVSLALDGCLCIGKHWMESKIIEYGICR